MTAVLIALAIVVGVVVVVLSIFGDSYFMLRHRGRGPRPFYPWIPGDEHRMVDPEDLTESWDRREWKLKPPDGVPWPSPEPAQERFDPNDG